MDNSVIYNVAAIEAAWYLLKGLDYRRMSKRSYPIYREDKIFALLPLPLDIVFFFYNQSNK